LKGPLGALLQLTEIIDDKPMQVPWDSNIFGRDVTSRHDITGLINMKKKLYIT